MTRGEELLEECKQHLLSTMARLPECASDQIGLGPKALETEAGFGLGLPGQDNWFTWSLLKALVNEGRLEQLDGKRGKVYRLPGAGSAAP